MLKRTTDKHKASRGLSTTAELLVWYSWYKAVNCHVKWNSRCKYWNSENGLCKLFADDASLECKMLAIWVVTFVHIYFVCLFICLFACLFLLFAACYWQIKLFTAHSKENWPMNLWLMTLLRFLHVLCSLLALVPSLISTNFPGLFRDTSKESKLSL